MFLHRSKLLFTFSIFLVFISCDTLDYRKSNVNHSTKKSVASYLSEFDNFSISDSDSTGNVKTAINQGQDNFDFENISRKYKLYLQGESNPTVYLPYDKDYSGPSKGDVGTEDIKREDGWRLLWKSFGSSTNGIKSPYYALYNIFTSEVKVFLYVANTNNDHSNYMVRATTGKPASQDSKNPSILSSYNQSNSYDDHSHVDTYSPTKVEEGKWAYFNFYMTGYDPDIGSGKYKNEYVSMELIGYDKTDINLSGTIDLQAIYSPGQGNLFTNFTKFLSKLPGKNSIVTKFLKNYKDTDESDDDLQEQFGDSFDEKIASVLGLALSTEVPGLSEISGLIGTAIGGSSGGKISRLAGTVTLSGDATTQYNNLANIFFTIPGVKRSADDPKPSWNIPTGFFSLTSQIQGYPYNRSRRCYDRDRGGRGYDCHGRYRERFDYHMNTPQVSVNPFFENNGYNIKVRAARVPLPRTDGEYQLPRTEFMKVSDITGGGCIVDTKFNRHCRQKVTIRAKIFRNGINNSTYFNSYGIAYLN